MVEAAAMRALITGSEGMLGSDIVKRFSAINGCTVLAFSKKDLDITNAQVVADIFKTARPDTVINCAAYTDVDGSESHKEEAMAINATGVKNLAIACRAAKAIMVHFSTDYVFDGKNPKGYDENAKRNPINAYGESKRRGEDALLQTLPNAYLVRTSWLFGKNGKNFVDTIKAKAGEKDIKVVTDQIGCPTYTADLAQAIPELLKSYPPGTYHLTNRGACTWNQFAQEIMRILGSKTSVLPMRSSELKRPAKRPACSILLNTTFKRKLPPWQDAVKRYLGVVG